MRTYILATVGTSMLSSVRQKLDLAPEQLPDEQKAIGCLRSNDPGERVCGAEINSIFNLMSGQELSAGTVEPPAVIQLLVSDTPEGEWSGHVLSQYFRKMPGVENADMEKVEGLDGADPKRFESQGLRSLVRLSAQHLQKAQEREPGALRVIDATGGYKAQISFAGLIGQVMKVPVVYLFEEFPRCIELPPLPVNFDRALWMEHFWLFSWLSDEMQIAARELAGYYIHDEISSLLDRENINGEEYVALSPILELMHQGFSLVPPVGLKQPADSRLEPQKKLRIIEKHMPHAPDGSRQCMNQLAGLSWVTRVENIQYDPTPHRSRVKVAGVETVDEIRVIHGDGSKGLEIRLFTTCKTDAEREWCLDELRNIMN